jgi:D-proline reductase (dithiol) PrdB
VSELSDDSEDFAEIERRFVREVVGVTDFEWMAFDDPSPRAALTVPLSAATVTLVSTAGAHAVGTKPLSAGGRAALVPTDADVQLSHVGYDTDRATQDLDVVYPVRTLQRLADEGFIGALAPTVVSTMGFVPEGRHLFERAVPAATERIHDEHAHLALLVPA